MFCNFDVHVCLVKFYFYCMRFEVASSACVLVLLLQSTCVLLQPSACVLSQPSACVLSLSKCMCTLKLVVSILCVFIQCRINNLSVSIPYNAFHLVSLFSTVVS